ncbi:MAG: FN3 domain-containing metallophosphoesterase family protein [Verrucomicrobiota bacterium]
MKLLLLALFVLPFGASAQIQRVWLSHKSSNPDKLVVNWETATPGDSIVDYGKSSKHGRTVVIRENVTLHHVEIEIPERDVTYHYTVRTGEHVSSDATFKSYPTDELRVAVVADWGYAKPDLSALRRDNVHLLLTAGDNVASLHQFCAAGVTNCIKAFSALIDREPELFRSTPFLPALGNHDKEVRPRGPKPPADAVYDVSATAFREFFELPGDEWKWLFDIPDFDARFVALDLNHIQDLGTTWQTCRPFAPGSEQFEWYRRTMAGAQPVFVFTIYNEKHSSMRAQAKGEWGRLITRGSAAITGFGYFAERAEVDGFPCFNTSLKGSGDRYPDPQSKFLASEDNYVLLTFKRGASEMTVALKNLKGAILDQRTIKRR